MRKLAKLKKVDSRRVIGVQGLRQLCAEYDFYTLGTREEYESLLNKVAPRYSQEDDNLLNSVRTPELTDELLFEIAEDIFNHTDTIKIIDDYGCSLNDLMESIIAHIIDASHTICKIKDIEYSTIDADDKDSIKNHRSDTNAPTTPCDYPDEEGNHNCPYFNHYSGYGDEMCRVCCGLGVDEDSYSEEEI